MTRRAVFHDTGTFDDGAGTITTFPSAVSSVFGRTGAVVAVTGDYYGAVAAALTGATQASRYVGATASGAPASGTFVKGDWVVAQDGAIFVCTTGGTPGTWLQVGAAPSFATPSITLDASAAAGAASTVIRSDSTIAAFDATNPTTQAFGDAAAVGTAAFAARRDHKHAMPALGTGATNACAGNDSRLSDARTPTGSAGGALAGTYPNPDLASAIGGTGLSFSSNVLSVIGGWSAIAQVAGSDFDTTSATLVDITGLSVAVAASHNYEIEAVLDLQTTTDSNGAKFGIQFSASGGGGRGVFVGGATSGVTSPVNALATATSSGFLTAVTTGFVVFKGVVTVGSSAGNITIQALHVSGGGHTIVKVGSILKVRALT